MPTPPPESSHGASCWNIVGSCIENYETRLGSIPSGLRTVGTYVSRIVSKLETHSRTDAIVRVLGAYRTKASKTPTIGHI